MSPTTGEALIFDTLKLEAINVVEAHKSPLSSVTLNSEGTLLATASDKGTIIRVFSVPDAHKLYQFRRGSMPARIFSMSFNTTSTLLCVSSATETVHIFKLGHQGSAGARPGSPSSPGRPFSPMNDRGITEGSEVRDEDQDSNLSSEATDFSNRKPNGSFMGIIRRTSQNVSNTFASTVGGYLPKGVTEMWEPDRDFAWIRIPKNGSGARNSVGSGNGLDPTANSTPVRSVVAMSSNTPQVMVVTSEGNFYVFNIDLSKGGEGTLTKQYS